MKARLDKMGVLANSNTQKVGYQLLAADGAWVKAKDLGIANAGSRVRDLRKEAFGQFRVDCVVEGGDTLYRIPKRAVRAAQIRQLFRV